MSKTMKRLLWGYVAAFAAYGVMRMIEDGPTPQKSAVNIPAAGWFMLAGAVGLAAVWMRIRKAFSQAAPATAQEDNSPWMPAPSYAHNSRSEGTSRGGTDYIPRTR